MINTSESCTAFDLEALFQQLTLQAFNTIYTRTVQSSRKTQRWAENTEFSTTYSGTVLTKMKELACTKSFWQFHFKQIQCSFMELLSFSAFVNLFKYTALSNAYKLADTWKLLLFFWFKRVTILIIVYILMRRKRKCN